MKELRSRSSFSYKRARKGRVVLDYAFGTRGKALRLQHSGFSDPEDDFTWSDGPRSTLLLSGKVPPRGALLVLTGRPFVHVPHLIQQTFTVTIDLVEMGAYTADDDFTIVIPIPVAIDGLTPRLITLSYLTPTAPSTFSGSDSRLISIAWRRLLVVESAYRPSSLTEARRGTATSFPLPRDLSVFGKLAQQISVIRDPAEFEGLSPELVKQAGFHRLRAFRISPGISNQKNNQVACFLSTASFWTLSWPPPFIRGDVDQFARQRIILRMLLCLPALETFAYNQDYSLSFLFEFSADVAKSMSGRTFFQESIVENGGILTIPEFPLLNGIHANDLVDYTQFVLNVLDRASLSSYYANATAQGKQKATEDLGDLEVGKMLTEDNYSTGILECGVYGFDIGRVFIPVPRQSQRILFHTQGRVIGQVEASDPCFVEVPLSTRGNIGIDLPDRMRPFDLGLNDDKRALSIGIVSVQPVRDASAAGSVHVRERRCDRLIKDAGLSRTDLARLVESIGDNCELGMVQREFGEEPLGLFRFAQTRIDLMANIFENEFSGFAAEGSLELAFVDASDEYFAVDNQYGFHFHTWIFRGDLDETALLAREYGRLSFLSRKLLAAAKSPTKVFVFRDHASASEESILRLLNALRSLSQQNNLLLVKDRLDFECKPRLQRMLRDLWVGWIDPPIRPGYEWWATAESWVELLVELAIAVRQR